jgi:large subunit ribosomal protein L14
MIYPQTILTVADNTGAKKVMYSNIRRKNMQKLVIMVVVKEATPNMPIKRSDIIRAIVAELKKTIRRQDGMYILI